MFNLAPGQQHFLTLFSVEKNPVIDMIKIECGRWLQNGYLFRRSFVHILEMCIFFYYNFWLFMKNISCWTLAIYCTKCTSFVRINSFFQSILWYIDTVWNSSLIYLEDVQISAASIIAGMRVNSSRTILYDELRWDALSDKRKVHELILFYKMVHG